MAMKWWSLPKPIHRRKAIVNPMPAAPIRLGYFAIRCRSPMDNCSLATLAIHCESLTHNWAIKELQLHDSISDSISSSLMSPVLTTYLTYLYYQRQSTVPSAAQLPTVVRCGSLIQLKWWLGVCQPKHHSSMKSQKCRPPRLLELPVVKSSNF